MFEGFYDLILMYKNKAIKREDFIKKWGFEQKYLNEFKKSLFKITVCYPSGQYLSNRNGEPLFFNTVNEALRYLHGYNFTLSELLRLDFYFEGKDVQQK